ncbi:MAG: leucine-rich repeat domain-containing protein [Bacteroidales bacterium]|nr:leucine-rich repeat domain-containing protein [Bacteroidales bacterium]
MRRWLLLMFMFLSVAAVAQPDRVYKSLKDVSDPEEVYILRLRGKRLKRIPPQVYGMTNLRELDLQGNRIASLSDSIVLLANLERLVLSRNPIDSLPPVMAGMEQLRELVLWSTRVTSLPKEFAVLDGTLELLDLRSCRLLLDEQEAIEALLPSVKKLWDYACNCPD